MFFLSYTLGKPPEADSEEHPRRFLRYALNLRSFLLLRPDADLYSIFWISFFKR